MKKINLDLSFTGYTIDTYQTFTFDQDEERIIDEYNDPDMYSTSSKDDVGYDDIEWEYDNEGYVQALADNFVELMNDNILDDVILNVKAHGKAWSPKYYNHSTDNCDITWEIDEKKLDEYIEKNNEHYEMNKLKSCDGFMWFGDEITTRLNYYIGVVSMKKYDDMAYMYDQMDSVPAYEYIDYKLIK